MYRPRDGRNYMGLFLLLLQVAQIGWDNIPPVTLLVGIVNVLIHYGKLPLGIYDVCIGAGAVWHKFQSEWSRLILASFWHVDDIHLYYNMVSLLIKGRELEPRLGAKVLRTTNGHLSHHSFHLSSNCEI